jgi:hypothetical protein
MVIDQFDEMLEQSRKYPLVFAVSAHPFIIGQPFRLRAFRDAVRYIVRHRDRSSGMVGWGLMPVRNLPNAAKVWEPCKAKCSTARGPR